MTQITSQLHITDISTAREIDKEQFDRVVTVCQDPIGDNLSGEHEYDFFCMADGPAGGYGGDDSFEMFEDAASTIEQALEDGETVLVHCHAGISRSVSTSTAALASHRDLSFEEAFELVKDQRSRANPNTYMVKQVCRYIGQEHEMLDYEPESYTSLGV